MNMYRRIKSLLGSNRKLALGSDLTQEPQSVSRKFHKPRADQVFIGKCISCGRYLHVKHVAIRPNQHFTCKCRQSVQVDDAVVVRYLIEGFCSQNQSWSRECTKRIRGIAVKAMPQLIDLLLYGHRVDIRVRTAELLGDLGRKEAIGPLVKALGDNEAMFISNPVSLTNDIHWEEEERKAKAGIQDGYHRRVSKAAGDALEKLTGLHFGEDPERWQAWMITQSENPMDIEQPGNAT